MSAAKADNLALFICSFKGLIKVCCVTDEFDIKDILAKAMKKQQDKHVRVGIQFKQFISLVTWATGPSLQLLHILWI